MNIDLSSGDDANSADLIAALEVGEQAIRGGRFTVYSRELLDEIERDARNQSSE